MLLLNGAILIDKPAEISSFGVIEQLQSALARRYGVKKKELPSFGHGGTLDPFATGLLIVFVGSGVKLSRYFLKSHKIYDADIAFGEQTESGDFTTPINKRSENIPKDIESIQTAANGFLGAPYLQTPPMYSAKKKDGVRLYEMARDGITIERDSVSLTIFDFKIKSYQQPIANFQVTCSSGTYIRTLAEDLAARLDTFAHLKTLRRVGSSPFHLSNSITLDHLLSTIEKGAEIKNQKSFVPFDHLMNHFEQLQIDADVAKKIRQGNRETVKELNLKINPSLAKDSILVLKKDEQLVAVMRKTDLFFELERVFQI